MKNKPRVCFQKCCIRWHLLCVYKVHCIDHGILAYSEKVDRNSKGTFIIQPAWEQCFPRSGRRGPTIGRGITDTTSMWVTECVSDDKSVGIFPIQTDTAPRQKPNWCLFNNSEICHWICGGVPHLLSAQSKTLGKIWGRCFEMKWCFSADAWGVVRCFAY